jgi:hypothetical protein
MGAENSDVPLYVFEELARALRVKIFDKDWSNATPEFIARVEQLRAAERRLLRSRARVPHVVLDPSGQWSFCFDEPRDLI